MMNKEQKNDLYLLLVKVLLVAVDTGIFSAAWYLYYSRRIYVETFYSKGHLFVIALFVVLYVSLAKL